ncbi:4-coumarate--CoA ligase 9 [Spatholobus suberectus]|nr:4-coumarate--CoA ligase 9 [Spatholobus suberectus]
MLWLLLESELNVDIVYGVDTASVVATVRLELSLPDLERLKCLEYFATAALPLPTRTRSCRSPSRRTSLRSNPSASRWTPLAIRCCQTLGRSVEKAHPTQIQGAASTALPRTFHSLKPQLLLPPPDAAVSAATYAISLRRNSPWPDSVTALIDAATGRRLSYGELIHRAETLAANLTSVLKLSKGDTALVLSPNLLQVPILCFALLSLGVVVSPANPLSTRSELTRLFHVSKPAIVFAATSVAEKTREFGVKTVLLDSPEFDSLTKTKAPSGLGPPRE